MINVEECVTLETLFCKNNQLKQLDVSSCNSLTELSVDPNVIVIGGETENFNST